MNAKKIHRVLGILLTLPLLAWGLTGILFLTKPGYQGAYERLAIKTYPLEQAINFSPTKAWHQARVLRTVLGEHLLLSDSQRQWHLHPSTGANFARPAKPDIRRLIEDAMQANPTRYGTVAEVTPTGVITNTGVEITLDWINLSLQQRGRDTRIIDTLYKIHYLQWLGLPQLNKALGGLGILLLLALVFFGWINWRGKTAKSEK